MPQKPIQFQQRMSLNELNARYGTEDQCEQALEQARWPGGFVCPECGVREHSRFVADGRRDWQYSTCRNQSTVCSGTLFHASKLPLASWFQANYLVSQNENQRQEQPLGPVAQTPSRRCLHHRLAAHAQADRSQAAARESASAARRDVCRLCGARRCAGQQAPGRGSENKRPFMTAVEITEEGHPLHRRFDAMGD
jgi:hypothetical protein